MAKKPAPARIAPKQQPKSRPAARDPRPASTGAGRTTFVIIALALTAAFYFPSISNGLVNWDDDPNITENPNLERVGKGAAWGETVANIFSREKGAVIGNYNPLPILTFAIEKAMNKGEFSPTLIHFNNLLLHLLTTFLAMLLLWRMGIGNWGVLLGGLLFGLHPMRVESVAWATERKDVLFGMFFFASLLYYTAYLKAQEKGRQTRYYLLAFGMALLSCYSKVQGVTLFLSMFALDYFYARPLNGKLFLEKIPFFALFLIFGLINVQTLAAQGSFDDQLTEFDFLDRIFIGTSSFCVYLYKLLLPYPMSPLYPYPKPMPFIMKLGPIGFLAAIGLFVWLVRRKNRIAVFGTAFFFVNVMFLLQWKGAGQGFLADRFTYVPYFGFFAIAAYYFDQYYRRESWRSGLQIGLGVLTLIYGIWTVRQIGIWKDGGTLWSHVMKFEQKTNPLPYVNRGQYYRNQMGNYNAALSDYSTAITIEKTNPELFNSRGKTYFDMAMSGKYKNQENALVQKAIEDYNTGLALPKIKPKTKAEILINRGAALGSRGQFAESLRSLDEGIALEPTNKNGYFNRSIALFSLSQTEKGQEVAYMNKALADYQKYLEFDPNNANVWYESGMIQRTLNKNQEALQALNQAIRLNSNFGLAYRERARVQAQSGNKAAAQQDYQRAQQMGVPMEPDDSKLMAQ